MNATPVTLRRVKWNAGEGFIWLDVGEGACPGAFSDEKFIAIPAAAYDDLAARLDAAIADRASGVSDALNLLGRIQATLATHSYAGYSWVSDVSKWIVAYEEKHRAALAASSPSRSSGGESKGGVA